MGLAQFMVGKAGVETSGDGWVAMPQELRHMRKTRAALKQVTRKGVAKCMWVPALNPGMVSDSFQCQINPAFG